MQKATRQHNLNYLFFQIGVRTVCLRILDVTLFMLVQTGLAYCKTFNLLIFFKNFLFRISIKQQICSVRTN